MFVSATSVSQDAELRKEFYKSAESRLSLLRSIGVTEMEKQYERKLKFVMDRSKKLEINEDQQLEEIDVKEILRDVLNELHSKDNKIK